MDGNGQTTAELGSFEWIWEKRLLTLDAQRMNPDHLEGLRGKVMSIAAALQSFRTERQRLTASGKFSPHGLDEATREAAAQTAGAIRRTLDTTHLMENLRQHQDKLRLKVTGDTTQQLLDFWKEMELRTVYQQLGVLITDAATGSVTVDTVKARALYQEALSRGDHPAQRALENWPVYEVVPAELREQGLRQRQSAVDPRAAKVLRDLEALHATMQEALKDAPQELPPAAPDDVIAERARGDHHA